MIITSLKSYASWITLSLAIINIDYNITQTDLRSNTNEGAFAFTSDHTVPQQIIIQCYNELVHITYIRLDILYSSCLKI